MEEEQEVERILDNRYQLGPEMFRKTETGPVWEAKDIEGRRFCVKEVLFERVEGKKKDLQHLEKEIRTQACLRHPNLTRILKVYQTGTRYLLLQEFPTGRTLSELIADGKCTEDEARRIFQGIVCGVWYLHRNGLCHRDLQLSNIVVDDDGSVKICDFGVSTPFVDRETNKLISIQTAPLGSEYFMAPEVILGNQRDGSKVDIWALGVLLYVLVTGEYPYDNDPGEGKAHSKRARVEKILMASPDYPVMSAGVENLLKSIFVVDPDERPGINDIIGDSWVSQGFQLSRGLPMDEFDGEKMVKYVDDPHPGILAPLTIFQLIGVMNPVTLERQSLVTSFTMELSEEEVRRAIMRLQTTRAVFTPVFSGMMAEWDDHDFLVTFCPLKGMTIVGIENINVASQDGELGQKVRAFAEWLEKRLTRAQEKECAQEQRGGIKYWQSFTFGFKV